MPKKKYYSVEQTKSLTNYFVKLREDAGYKQGDLATTILQDYSHSALTSKHTVQRAISGFENYDWENVIDMRGSTYIQFLAAVDVLALDEAQKKPLVNNIQELNPNFVLPPMSDIEEPVPCYHYEIVLTKDAISTQKRSLIDSLLVGNRGLNITQKLYGSPFGKNQKNLTVLVYCREGMLEEGVRQELMRMDFIDRVSPYRLPLSS
ncbi:hypothetical protein CL622_06665 [archaeon]|nr:hypothetical protein [archaeon]